MTELSFLIELLLNHDLPKATKDLIASRIKEVEQKISAPITHIATTGFITPTTDQLQIKMVPGTYQAPSTLAAMARHNGTTVSLPIVPEPPPVPVETIAQTPATAAAMNSRNQAISDAISGKIDKTSGKPRKW